MVDLPIGLAQQFLHPPLGLLRPHLDYHGPYSGNVTVDQWSATAGPVFTNYDVSDTFGVLVQLNGGIPAGYGLTLGWVSDDAQYSGDVYDERLLQVVVQHQLLGGAWVTSQLEEVFDFPLAILWREALPGRIGLLAAPGLAFDLFFLQVN